MLVAEAVVPAEFADEDFAAVAATELLLFTSPAASSSDIHVVKDIHHVTKYTVALLLVTRSPDGLYECQHCSYLFGWPVLVRVVPREVATYVTASMTIRSDVVAA